jgi:hypothetical protein
MHEYRLYIFDEDGTPLGPGRPVLADDDEAALAIVHTFVDGNDWILCDGNRIVKEVKRQR